MIYIIKFKIKKFQENFISVQSLGPALTTSGPDYS